MKDFTILSTAEKLNLQRQFASLEKTYTQANPQNFPIIQDIIQAIDNQSINYQELGVSEEVFYLMLDEVKRIALELSTKYLISSDNSWESIYLPYQEGESQLNRQEKLFLKQALNSQIIKMEEIDQAQDYSFAFNLPRRRQFAKPKHKSEKILPHGFFSFFAQNMFY